MPNLKYPITVKQKPYNHSECLILCNQREVPSSVLGRFLLFCGKSEYQLTYTETSTWDDDTVQDVFLKSVAAPQIQFRFSYFKNTKNVMLHWSSLDSQNKWHLNTFRTCKATIALTVIPDAALSMEAAAEFMNGVARTKYSEDSEDVSRNIPPMLATM